MRIDFRRVFLITLVFALGGALVGVRLLRDEPRVDVSARGDAETTHAPAAPVLDASDPAVRRVLAMVSANDGATSKLFQTCASEQPDRIRMATTPGYRPEARQRELKVERRGQGATLEYFDRGFPPRFEASDTIHRKVSIDAAEWNALAKVFADAGYPHGIEPSDDDGCVDGGWRRIESCLGGRYYAVFRSCEARVVDRLSGEVFAFARAKVAAKGHDVPPQPVTFAGEFITHAHGALVRRDDNGESFLLTVPQRIATSAQIERLFALGYESRRGNSVVRGQFTGLLRGPEGMHWFELQSADDLQVVEE